MSKTVINYNYSIRTDAISDLMQADKWVLWDSRSSGMIAQLSSQGFTPEELEKLLLHLAADVHKHLTGVECGALIIETGEGGPLDYCLRKFEVEDGLLSHDHAPLKGFSDRFNDLRNERWIR